jgi:hypothetical protein
MKTLQKLKAVVAVLFDSGEILNLGEVKQRYLQHTSIDNSQEPIFAPSQRTESEMFLFDDDTAYFAGKEETYVNVPIEK